MPSKQTEYLIERILPLGSIHVVAGPSGAGKSRWILETMLRTEQFEPIFGYPSHRYPWLYVTADRQEDEMWQTIDSLGISRERIPLLPAFAPLLRVGEVFEHIERTGAEVVVWEGFGAYVGDGAGSATVRRWLSMITERLRKNASGQLRERPLTIIGVLEQPKMKPKDRYANPRQRISGPAAWGHSVSTIILVDFANDECEGPERKISVFPRNEKDMEYNATLETGHFVLTP